MLVVRLNSFKEPNLGSGLSQGKASDSLSMSPNFVLAFKALASVHPINLDESQPVKFEFDPGVSQSRDC